ncbi:unnamed protein product, partial [Phaeothamnion confervicola]
SVAQAFTNHEDTAAFTWIFKHFKEACCPRDATGKPIEPVTIITDADPAAAAGVRAELPNSKHFLCSWHFMMNVNKHASEAWGGGGGKRSKKEGGDVTEESTDKMEFLRLFKKAMYSTSEAAFDGHWATLMGWEGLSQKPKLVAHLKRLHRDRHRWAFYC